MKIDLNDPYFVDKFLVSNEVISKKRILWGRIILISCIFLYFFVAFAQPFFADNADVIRFLAPFEIFFSVTMVLGTVKSAYKIAFFINFLNMVCTLLYYFYSMDLSVLPSMVIPFIAIIVVATIRLFDKGVHAKIHKIVKQNEELGMLYEEIAATEEELAEQNRQLHDFNRDLQKNEEKLHYLAYYDVLTELPNRKMIFDKLDSLINEENCNKKTFALVFIDLDNFKKINDSLGHNAGDTLLKTVVNRLKSVIHPEDLLGRLGGDEFALIIQRQFEEDSLLQYLENIRETLINSFNIQDSKFVISASFGVSIFPQDGEDATELIKSADTAMYKAKENGRNGIELFDIEMKNEILDKIHFESILREAIEHEELHLVYQPQYTSRDKELRGIEVLTRWDSPQLGFVSPAKFIPVAEETGMIIPLGEWIIRTACLKSKHISESFKYDVVMSINISAVQIMEPTFVDTIQKIIIETGCNPQNIEFEITESVFISSMDYVINVLKKIRSFGIRIALDDFGTGYSSLNYLQRLPIDTLKIDKSFVDSINQQQAKKPIVGSIISLVHQMDITVVAEGVENEAQLLYLKKQECDYIQGYYWGKPITEDSLEKLLIQLNT